MHIDQEILEACLKQKRSAQNELYKLVFSYLMNICIRYKNDYQTAGASLNSIFLKILNNLESYHPENSFQAWIKRIAINHLIDEYRKDKRHKKNLVYVEDHQKHSPKSSSPHEKELEMDSEYLLDLIKKLPTMTKKVFNLYAIDGFKHREIAELLDMSENTSKWHLREARKKLQNELTKFHKLQEI